MKKLVFILLGITVATGAGAQQKWTLRQCIDYAVENNIDIRQSALQVEGAEIELNTAQNSRLPNLNAGMNQNFGFGRTSVRYTDPESGAVYDRYENTRSSGTSFSVSAGIPVFRGFNINNRIKAGKIDLEVAAQGLERAKQDLELNVAALYLDALLKKEILAVYRGQTALTREQVARTTAMVDEGKVARSQLYEIEAQLAGNEVSEVEASNNLATSLLNLSQALNLGNVSGFDIEEVNTEAFTPTAFAGLSSPDAIYQTAVGIRPVVREAELRLKSSELGVKIAQSAYMPSLDLSANVNSGYQYVFGKSGQPSFSDQLRDQLREGVGLSLSIPIFNRNATRNNVRSARLAVMNQTLALEGVRQALYKEIQQAWQGAVSAGARYEATTKALTASEEAVRTVRLRYDEGKATVYEYDEAQTRLIESRSNQAQAKYDYLFRTRILDFYAGREIEI